MCLGMSSASLTSLLSLDNQPILQGLEQDDVCLNIARTGWDFSDSSPVWHAAPYSKSNHLRSLCPAGLTTSTPSLCNGLQTSTAKARRSAARPTTTSGRNARAPTMSCRGEGRNTSGCCSSPGPASPRLQRSGR